MTPRYVGVSFWCSVCPFSFKCTLCCWLERLKIVKVVFFLLTWTSHAWAHNSITWSACCSLQFAVLMYSSLHHNTMSSVQMALWMFLGTWCRMSRMKTNGVGDSTPPWGTLAWGSSFCRVVLPGLLLSCCACTVQTICTFAQRHHAGAISINSIKWR